MVDPDALPNSERPSPAAPITVTAAVLVVRFFLEACLTRRMVASSLLGKHACAGTYSSLFDLRRSRSGDSDLIAMPPVIFAFLLGFGPGINRDAIMARAAAGK